MSRGDPAPPAPKRTTSAAGAQTCDRMRLRTGDATPPPPGLLRNERVLPNRIDSDEVRVLALAESGEVVRTVGARTESTGYEEVELHPGTLSVFDPATGRTERVRDDDRDGVHATWAALSRRHAVWLEDASVIHSFDWKLYAASRTTGEVTQVAESTPKERYGFGGLLLHDGWVYWSGTDTGIYARELDSGAPARRLVAKAGLPAATKGWLYYVDESRHAIHRRSLATGATTLVREVSGPEVTSLAVHGDTMAWSTDAGVEIVGSGKRVAVVKPKPGEQLSNVAAGADAVGFVGDGSAYLVDLRTGCLHNLGDAGDASAIRIAGRMVAWAMPEAWHHAALT